ncbi:uracil-DNA glycosylase [Rubrivirga sp.]|uniref:uracil-DNA glycosylase n=1 Tax=Rubrivirga sp. TaxID=1885344 RepID=UPI003C75E063
MADVAPTLSDLLREARHLIGVQREIVGSVRYLGGLPAEEELGATAERQSGLILEDDTSPGIDETSDLESRQADAKTTDARVLVEEAALPDLEDDSLEDDLQPLISETVSLTALEDAPAADPEGESGSPALEDETAPADTPEPTAPAAVDNGPLSSDDVPDLFGALPDPSLDESLSPYERIEALIPDDSPLHDMTSLDEVYAWLSETELVPIDKERINPVLGTGDPNADLMVIGEAPGADEDRQGIPFVGRSGQLLDKILEAVLFKRDEVYICNILKSRPPNNRDPLPEEVEAHMPILFKQIALVRPKVLLAVGKSAGNGLLKKKSSLASLRGTFQDFYGLPLLVTYHPAALLRNPQWKRPTWEDVKLLRTRYDQLTEG